MEPDTTQPQDHPTEPLLEAILVQARQIGEETNGLLQAILVQNQKIIAALERMATTEIEETPAEVDVI